jgi:DNA repair ATPase RecN
MVLNTPGFIDHLHVSQHELDGDRQEIAKHQTASDEAAKQIGMLQGNLDEMAHVRPADDKAAVNTRDQFQKNAAAKDAEIKTQMGNIDKAAATLDGQRNVALANLTNDQKTLVAPLVKLSLAELQSPDGQAKIAALPADLQARVNVYVKASIEYDTTCKQIMATIDQLGADRTSLKSVAETADKLHVWFKKQGHEDKEVLKWKKELSSDLHDMANKLKKQAAKDDKKVNKDKKEIGDLTNDAAAKRDQAAAIEAERNNLPK